jgi:hypothetical protein
VLRGRTTPPASSASCQGAAQHRPRDDRVHQRCGTVSVGVEHGGRRTEHVVDRRHPGIDAVAHDPLALAGLIDRGPAGSLARTGGVEARERADHLDLRRSARVFGFGLGACERTSGGADRGPLPPATRKGPAQLAADDPRRGAIGQPRPAGLDRRLRDELGSERGARLVTRRFGGARRRGGTRHLRPSSHRLGQQPVQIGAIEFVGDGEPRLDRLDCGAERVAHQAIELGPGDRAIAAGLNHTLLQIRLLDDQSEDVRVGREAGIAAALGACDVLTRRGKCGIRRPTGRIGADRASERFGHGERQVGGRLVAAGRGGVAIGRGGARHRPLPPAVEQRLLDAEAGPKEAGRIGMVQRIDREIRRRKPAR